MSEVDMERKEAVRERKKPAEGPKYTGADMSLPSEPEKDAGREDRGLMDLACKEYIDRLSSKAPVPGGGGAAAMVAAVGAALCSMVGNLTVGKKKYADVENEIQDLMKKLSRLTGELEDLVQADADSFAPLAAAYRLPHVTPEEIRVRDEEKEKCLKTACSAPFQIMRKICDVISMIGVFAEKGSAVAVSDAGVAAAICSAALRGAALNVFINTRSMRDREYAGRINSEAREMLEIYAPIGDSIYDEVSGGLLEGQYDGRN